MPVTVRNGSNSRTFFVHLDLLIQNSEHFSDILTSGLYDTSEYSMVLYDQDIKLFGHFIDYLYRRNRPLFTEPVQPEQYILLARLYAFGHRYKARKLQQHCLQPFTIYPQHIKGICKILEIVVTELPETIPEDLLRKHVFWQATSQMGSLLLDDEYWKLLREFPDLGRGICRWFGKPRPRSRATPSLMEEWRVVDQDDERKRRCGESSGCTGQVKGSDVIMSGM